MKYFTELSIEYIKNNGRFLEENIIEYMHCGKKHYSRYETYYIEKDDIFVRWYSVKEHHITNNFTTDEPNDLYLRRIYNIPFPKVNDNIVPFDGNSTYMRF